MTTPRYCNLLKNLVEFFRAKKVLELGTSLGITTLYLASAEHNPHITTVEGAETIAKIAKENFSSFGFDIKLIVNDFDSFWKQNTEIYDIVFIDGNHTFDATVRYFDFAKKLNNNIIIVFDDIRWSRQMYQVWQQIEKKSDKGIFIDLFKMGIAIFNENFDRKEFAYFML